jgi:SRSO17 transposase
MVTIGRIPRIAQAFFRPLRRHFARPAWDHFWGLVVAITVSHGSTIDRLAKMLRGSTHRTNHGEFLWRSDWSESAVMQQIALDLLRSLHRKNGGPCYLILDDTQTLKRAKKMDGVGKLFHHATGKYGTGHTILKVCLHYRGVTIPWGSWLWLKRPDARKLDRPFLKLTQLAAMAVHNADLPKDLKVVVLFDCYYLCPVVVDACQCRGWHYVGVGKSNRNFTVDGSKRRLDRYGANVVRRSGRWHRVQGLRTTRPYRLASRTGWMKKLGEVQVVFSRRRGERKVLALVTDDLRASARKVVADYLKRWAIELLIKDEKQQLGLGDYRVRRYRAVVRHLHLVDVAYACLTHLGLQDLGAQGRKKRTKVLHLPPISHLKTRMRQLVWREAIEDVVKNTDDKRVIRRLERLLVGALAA